MLMLTLIQSVELMLAVVGLNEDILVEVTHQSPNRTGFISFPCYSNKEEWTTVWTKRPAGSQRVELGKGNVELSQCQTVERSS